MFTAGVFNPRPPGRMRPASEFSMTPEGYFTKDKALWILKLKSLHTMGGSSGDVSEEPVTWEKRKYGWRISCDVGEATKVLKSSFSNLSVTSPTLQLILQPFRRFTYVTAHSSTLSLLHLRHS